MTDRQVRRSRVQWRLAVLEVLVGAALGAVTNIFTSLAPWSWAKNLAWMVWAFAGLTLVLVVLTLMRQYRNSEDPGGLASP